MTAMIPHAVVAEMAANAAADLAAAITHDALYVASKVHASAKCKLRLASIYPARAKLRTQQVDIIDLDDESRNLAGLLADALDRVAELEAQLTTREALDFARELGIEDTYTVSLGSWDAMEAEVLARVVDQAGSIRQAAPILGVPRSTLSARIRKHRERGTWPSADAAL